MSFVGGFLLRLRKDVLILGSLTSSVPRQLRRSETPPGLDLGNLLGEFHHLASWLILSIRGPLYLANGEQFLVVSLWFLGLLGAVGILSVEIGHIFDIPRRGTRNAALSHGSMVFDGRVSALGHARAVSNLMYKLSRLVVIIWVVHGAREGKCPLLVGRVAPLGSDPLNL